MVMFRSRFADVFLFSSRWEVGHSSFLPITDVIP